MTIESANTDTSVDAGDQPQDEERPEDRDDADADRQGRGDEAAEDDDQQDQRDRDRDRLGLREVVLDLLADFGEDRFEPADADLDRRSSSVYFGVSSLGDVAALGVVARDLGDDDRLRAVLALSGEAGPSPQCEMT